MTITNGKITLGYKAVDTAYLTAFQNLLTSTL